MKFSKPTLADVARLAQVSPTTAARVVHDNGYVSDENRQSVLRAVETLAYRPNLQARSLRTQRSQTLGLIYSDEDNPAFTRLSHAIRTAARTAGYSMLSVDHDNVAESEIDGISQFLDHRVDAVITCHAFDPAAYLQLRQVGIPLIQIERPILSETHIIAYDTQPGLSQALANLISFGHSRIGFIGGADTLMDRVNLATEIEMQRAEMFRTEAVRRGLRPVDCPILLGDYAHRDENGHLSGQTLAAAMLDGPVPVTAIIAGSDLLAAGILHELYARGMRLPEDFSLIGYDDSIADLLAPQLSSISQPYDQIAAAALDIVTHCRESDALLRREVSTRLVSRNSVGAAVRRS